MIKNWRKSDVVRPNSGIEILQNSMEDSLSCWIATFARLSGMAAFGWFDLTAILPVLLLTRRLSPIIWTAFFMPEPSEETQQQRRPPVTFTTRCCKYIQIAPILDRYGEGK